MDFNELSLNPLLLKSVAELGYITPTEIQAKVIPLLLTEECDFIGQAQTGTGKTAAFALPLLEKIDIKSRHIQALILAPTRELANQVKEEIVKLGKHLKIRVEAIFGGASYDKQIYGIRHGHPHIIVGTPGRVIDLLEKGILKFETVSHVILDEADEMLNMGFLEDVNTILESTNEEKRIWMFSATMPRPIVNMINSQFKNPKMVSIQKKTVSNADIEQSYYVIRERNHKEALCRIFDMTPDIYGLIFCRTRLETRDLANELTLRGHKIEVLHGEMSQKERDFAMAQFKSKRTNIMVCTDVAARGIDVSNLTHVINYGLPQEIDSYIHRIGRTGRAGMKGIAITLVDSRDIYSIRRLEKMLGVTIARKDLPSVADLKAMKVLREIENMGPIFAALQDKKGDFKTDETFDLFKTYFEHLSKEEALKILFTWTFNSELKRLTDIGPLQEPRFEERQRHFSRPQSGGGRSRSNRGSGYHNRRRN
ncbi:MAG: hypothetical protein A2X86_21240 [Bdellovibrionales bacterium GWA2_49_15]|nr:MAG: hypothetical protein A2X86_21240 [Bdellovibrionales bacterium GWA2_49_15]HAZ14904.1 RNA helicase [Bdellovibrionales bacterium]